MTSLTTQNQNFEQAKKLVPYVYSRLLKKTSVSVREQEDVMQEGYLGLWHACQNFDPDKGFAFSTYATNCILNTMRKFVKKAFKHEESYSLDYTVDTGDDEVVLQDIIGEKDYSYETDFIKSTLNKVLEKSTENAKGAFVLSMKGVGQEDIAKQYNCSQPYVSKMLNRVKANIQKELMA